MNTTLDVKKNSRFTKDFKQKGSVFNTIRFSKLYCQI